MAAVVELRLPGAGGALPEPPYPAATRARGWRFEIDHERLVQSTTWRLAAMVPHAQNALLRIWVEAWQSIPAGSLPDDEEAIAAIVAVPPDWFREHLALLLRGFSRHADGRLYHRIVVEQVQRLLGIRKAEADRKSAFRARVNTKHVPPDNGHVPPDNANVHPESGHQNQNQNQNQNQKREKKEKTLGQTLPRSTGRARIQEPVAGFDAFWAAYPRHTGKAAALKAWVKREFTPEQADRVIAAVREQSKWPAWTKDNGQFVPHASTWLNGERWEDESPQDAGPSIWGSR